MDPTYEPYAIAKIEGVKLCENFNRRYGCDFISEMPTNLYEPYDNYDFKISHVLPDLLHRFLDVSLVNSLGWQYKIHLREGIERVYREKFLKA